MSDEQIVVMTHTDGYFQAAMDNAAGMASALEIARFYAQKPLSGTAAHDEVHPVPRSPSRRSRPRPPGVGIDATYPWDKVAVKLTMEHPSQTLLYMYNDGLTPTNAVGAFRWNALGSPEFEKMVFDTLREFGVSVYAQEDGPKNGNYAPSFHIIDHVIYHTSLDTPELVPASRPGARDARVRRGARSGEQDDDGAAARNDLPAEDRPGLARGDAETDQVVVQTSRISTPG